MGKQQLYINDLAVDMPNDSIKIKCESNITADADKIMTSHSYSLTLPRTVTNDNIMSQAYIPSADTAGKSTHRYLTASLSIDGVTLFRKGTAVVTKVEEKGYSLNLFWGIIGVFDSIKNEDLDLCDLPMSSHWSESTMATWVKVTQDMAGDVSGGIELSGMNNDIYNTLDSDSKDLVDTMPWTLPVIPADTILSKISSVYGITFDTSPFTQLEIYKLYHPITTLRVMCDDETLTMQIGVINRKVAKKWHAVLYLPSLDADGLRNYAVYSPLIDQNAAATNKHIANDAVAVEDNGVDVFYRANRELSIKSLRVKGSCSEEWDAICMLTDIVSQRQATSHYDSLTNMWVLDHTWTDITAKEGDSLIGLGYGELNTAPTTSIYVTIEFEQIKDAKRGDWICLERNYPKMGIISYLGELLAHCGSCIVGSVTEPDKLRIVQLDEIAERTASEFNSEGVKTINMTWEQLAQKNKYIHEDHEDTGLNYTGEGVVVVDDDTLSKEREAFSSSFKVPRLALVRLWKVEKNEQGSDYKATWDASGDYICGLDSITGTFMNTGQDFESIIASNYIHYSQAVRHPKSVEAVVRLSVLDLMDFDFAKPVYIKQLNRKYFVQSLESEDEDTYKLKLLQL